MTSRVSIVKKKKTLILRGSILWYSGHFTLNHLKRDLCVRSRGVRLSPSIPS